MASTKRINLIDRAIQIQVAETGESWRDMPEWMSYLTGLGLSWLKGSCGKRRIGLVSMPCDSAAAGLVALGAMCLRLTIPDTNDLAAHFRRIEALVTRQDSVTMLKVRGKQGRYVADETGDDGMVWVKRIDTEKRERRTISRSTSTQWQFVGEAPVQVVDGDELPYAEHYSAMVGGGLTISRANLRHSDSGICLAGHVRGGRWTQARMQALRINAAGGSADLSQLLAIQDWHPGKISRVSYFNSRTDKPDRQVGQPQLVVADGDVAFAKSVDRAEFRHSDVIGIYHRVIERDRLDALGKKIADLGQWYEVEGTVDANLPEAPRGIAVVILRQR